MRLGYVALAACLVLCGCGKSKTQQMAECHFEGAKAYPADDNPYDSTKVGAYADLCMEAKGYKFDAKNNAGCSFLDASCYSLPSLPERIRERVAS